ncbi:MAG: hypothetical protein WEB28_01660 [Nitrosopumilaceae archaeon]
MTVLGKINSFSSVFPVILLSLTLFVSAPFVNGDAEIKGHSATIGLDKSTYPIPVESNELKISIRIFDPDFNTSPTGIDQIAQDISGESGVGPVKISIMRGESVVLGYAGGKSSNSGQLDSEPIADLPSEKSQIRQFGPITETSPTSGIFEFDVSIKNTDGPESSKCQVSSEAQIRFDDSSASSRHCILQGDVLLVEYTDPTDGSGNSRKVTASATFSVLNSPQSLGSSSEKIATSKTVRIGHPLTLLLYDSNLNLDSDRAESYTLDLIQFESKNIRTTLGSSGGVQNEFNPQPSVLRETGDNTGIFYTVIEIPRTVNGQRIDVDEKIEFEYTQRGLGAFLVVYPDTFSPDMVNMPKNSVNLPLNEENLRSKQLVGIVCKEGFVKIFKHDGSPACVKPKTAEKLLERGWVRA